VELKDSEIAKAFRSRPFQKVGTKFAVANKNVLIADEPGLGKSLESIAAVIQAQITGSILIVAPKTAVYVTWPAELKRWLKDIAPDDIIRVVGGNQSKRERIREMRRILKWDIANSVQDIPGREFAPQRQWVIVSPNYLRFTIKLDDQGNYVYDANGDKIIEPVREAISALLAIDWATVIIDEAHLTLSGATGNIKTQSAQRRGLGLLEIQPDGLRLALSGTPFRGKHENLWGILNWLEPKQYTAYWEWIYKHFNVYMDPVFNQQVIGELKSEKALAHEVSRLMIRRTKAEVVKDLPRKLYGGTPLFDNGPIAVWLDMFDNQRKAYDDMVRVAMTELDGGTLMANGVLAEMIRLKQFANSYGYLDINQVFHPKLPSNKFDWILEFLRERGIDGKGPGNSKVIIASQFTKHVDLFATTLREKHKIPCFVLTGKTNEQDRVNLQRDFQRGRTDSGEDAPDVFLINTKAGGVSLTLDAADDVVIVDSTFNPDDQTQVEDRAHRLSRIHAVTVWNLASTGSIDESILRHTYKMDTSIARILDGERGVETLKLLLKDTL
jgi:Zierdtviridae DNA helicase